MPPFTEWLADQQHRDGELVGALAKGVAEYGTESIDLSVQSVRKALRLAWDEFYEVTGSGTEAPERP